jgi:chromate transporter
MSPVAQGTAGGSGPDAPDPVSPSGPPAPSGAPVGLGALFLLFLRAGMIFGGGLAVTAVLLQDLVQRRRAITRSHFLALYGLARLIPSGTTTALAVGLGHRFAGFPGTVVALLGVALPSLAPTIALTVLYDAVRDSPWLDLLPVTLLPAAVALLASAVLTMGREVDRRSIEPLLAAGAFAGAIALGINPGLLLVAGGALGALLLRPRRAP